MGARFTGGRISRGSWLDSTLHPKDPRARARPADHYRPLILKAIVRLKAERHWTDYRSRRYVADRLLSLLPWHTTTEALQIPRSALTDPIEDRQYLRARAWLMNRLKSGE